MVPVNNWDEYPKNEALIEAKDSYEKGINSEYLRIDSCGVCIEVRDALMKLSLLELMMLMVLGGMLVGCQNKMRQPDLDHAAILDGLVGKDLRDLSQKEISTLAKVLLKNPKAESLFSFPWYLWRTSDPGHIRYVLFEGEPIEIIPGNSSAAVHLLDSNGEVLEAWRFSAGWRMDLRDATFKYSAELDTDVLVLLTAPVINGRNVARQFFAFSNDRLRFIRLEDDKEQILQTIDIPIKRSA